MMKRSPRFLAFSGSLRRGSFNRLALAEAARGAREAGATVEEILLSDFPIPLFDQDLERQEGIPEAVRRLREHALAADGFLIGSPEYNGSVTGVLKNTLDWLSRPVAEGPDPSVFRNKVAGLVSASPGSLGGLRGLAHLRDILASLGLVVNPLQAALGGAREAFGPDGLLLDRKQRERLRSVGRSTADLAERLLREPAA